MTLQELNNKLLIHLNSKFKGSRLISATRMQVLNEVRQYVQTLKAHGEIDVVPFYDLEIINNNINLLYDIDLNIRLTDIEISTTFKF